MPVQSFERTAGSSGTPNTFIGAREVKLVLWQFYDHTGKRVTEVGFIADKELRRFPSTLKDFSGLAPQLRDQVLLALGLVDKIPEKGVEKPALPLPPRVTL